VLPVGVAGPGGDRVLPADWRGLLLMAAGTVAGGWAVGRLTIKRFVPEVEDG
jgi:hypothetical protein